jgi:hypothetical protein
VNDDSTLDKSLPESIFVTIIIIFDCSMLACGPERLIIGGGSLYWDRIVFICALCALPGKFTLIIIIS